jgi:hypothetical protein
MARGRRRQADRVDNLGAETRAANSRAVLGAAAVLDGGTTIGW